MLKALKSSKGLFNESKQKGSEGSDELGMLGNKMDP